ncbi:hypothetical protein [Niallia sp. 01092]|uniref:hypothetical protein n=1 Tax=unclassified Niallia TaxID=2837522 RepID=UPI003FCF2A1D
MNFYAQVIRGLKAIKSFSYELEKTEKIASLTKNIVLLFIVTTVLYGLSSFFGIGNEVVSRELTQYSASDFELNKLLFAIGQISWAWVFLSIHLFLVPLYFYAFTDIDYQKLLYIQFIAVFVLLLEKLLLLPLQLYFGLTPLSSIFSLGIIAQAITTKKIVYYFCTEITIFKLWMMYIQYKYLTALSGKNRSFILLLVVVIYVFFLLIAALTQYWKLEELI